MYYHILISCQINEYINLHIIFFWMSIPGHLEMDTWIEVTYQNMLTHITVKVFLAHTFNSGNKIKNGSLHLEAVLIQISRLPGI